MPAIDFANSYVSWTALPTARVVAPGMSARIRLDAACTIADPATGESRRFYLMAPCRSEHMYVAGALFTQPNYEFCGIWSDSELVFLRTHWISDRDNREYRRHEERVKGVRLDVREFEDTRVLATEPEIITATLENRPLIARTTIRDEATSPRAILEYPVITMNVMSEPPRFQVDTGPIPVPDFRSKAAHLIERFDVGHVVYNVFDRAEFILRRPTPVPSPDKPLVLTSDYSVSLFLTAENEICCPI